MLLREPRTLIHRAHARAQTTEQCEYTRRRPTSMPSRNPKEVFLMLLSDARQNIEKSAARLRIQT